jgi:tRNA U34 5-methylaminomethyl-2-thiouridine-forming methyltransferase MnmC
MSDHDLQNKHEPGPDGSGGTAAKPQHDANPEAVTVQTLDWHDGDMPYSQEFGDHFYCREDGRLECGHVFLGGNGLPERWQRIVSADQTFRIGELGFGTGLNFCETWRQWKETRLPGKQLHFHSFELFPMRKDEIDRALSRWPQIDAERKALAAAWPQIDGETGGRITVEADAQTTLTVHCGPAFAGVGAAPDTFDAWYLDGFAPSRNPDMWSKELMQLIFDKTVPGGSFATYAAAGFVRRNLVAAGFAVERPPGFAGKREMLRGTKA